MVDQNKINGEEDFDSIDLTFEDEKKESKPEEVESIDDLNFDAFNEDVGEVKDELHDDIKDKKIEPPTIKLDPTPVVSKPVVKNELEDIDIDLEVPSTVVDTVKNTEVVSNVVKSEEQDSLEIDLEVTSTPTPMNQVHEEPELISPPVEKKEEPKKRGRKPKVVLENPTPAQVEQVVAAVEELKQNTVEERNIQLDPLFDISKINTSKKYQTRAIERTPEQLKVFGDILKMQGQLEPIHLHKEGPEYFLVVGFGRYEAMKIAGFKTIKAIVHENLVDSDIIKLSTGTNENRLSLTEWDKIVAVGKFASEHPEISKDGPENSQCLTNIFGYGKSVIYANIEQYNYFIQHEEFVNYFKNNVVPQFVFRAIFDSKEHIGDEVEKYIKFIEDSKQMSRKDFNMSLAEFIANERIVKRIVEQESPTTNNAIELEPKDTTKSEIDKMVINLSENVKTGQKEDVEKIKKVSDLITEFGKNINAVEDTLKNLLAIDNVKQYIDNSRINSIGKKITNLSKLYLKIA